MVEQRKRPPFIFGFSRLHALRHVGRRRLAVAGALGAILLLGAFLRFYQLGAFSIGNAYYAATVKSMLASWHNFFYAAYEPGGSVSVDKPPLGFWMQFLSVRIFDFNGFALAFPNALAGVLSISLLFGMVRKPFGAAAGLAAALSLAVMPVTVATERNNTVDGLLIFVLLLAAWAFWRSVESEKVRYLMLGVFLVGLGFNIKMLQAYMSLPAFYLLYLLGARHPWRNRLVHLGLASLLLLVVSFSWVLAVDLTPASERPFVGSSANNSVMELVFGWNGLSRLVGGLNPGRPAQGLNLPPQGGARPGGLPVEDPGRVGNPTRPGNIPVAPVLPSGGGVPGAPPGMETGAPGLARLFTQPLVEEAGWLLPMALMGILFTFLALGWRWPLTERHLALVLWAGWLMPEGIYFSLTGGLFHAYYLIMLGPCLAALVGLCFWSVGRILEWKMGWALAFLAVTLTAALQISVLLIYPQYSWLAALLSVAGLAGILLLAAWRVLRYGWTAGLASAALAISLAAAPFAWCWAATSNTHPNAGLPNARLVQSAQGSGPQSPIGEPQVDPNLLYYLLENNQPDASLFAALSSHEASPYILATGRAVLTMGGFNGGDNVIDAQGLAEKVAQGKLRFVVGGPQLAQQKPDLNTWVVQHCQPVTLQGSLSTSSRGFPGPQGQAEGLYDCDQDR